MSKKPARRESGYKYKMVNGELVELTEDEIAALEQRDREAMQKPAPEQDDAERQPN